MNQVVRKPARLFKRTVRRVLPRRRGAIETYREEFPDTARAFEKFLARVPVVQINDSRPPIGVVVTPWVGTAGPWLMLTLALGLARRGRRVVLIWDDLPYGQDDPYTQLQNAAIDKMLVQAHPHLPHIRLSDQPPAPLQPGDDRLLDQLVMQNLIWSRRGQPPDEHALANSHVARASLARTLAHVRGLLRSRSWDSLVHVSGTVLGSGTYLAAAREQGTPLVTYDAGLGAIFICTDGVAAQQDDLPLACRELFAAPPEQRAQIVELAQRNFQARLRGKDRQNFQVAPPSGRHPLPPGSVVMPLSQEWDAANLGKHYLFDDTLDWVVSTVSFVLNETDRTIAVRQHPGERHKYGHNRLDVASVLHERFGAHPRLWFIKPTDPVNTYELLENAAIVLPYVSTIGVEAAALGKAVMPSGAVYYRQLGFVWSAHSRQEYLDILGRTVRGGLPLLPHQQERAWITYYLSLICNLNWTFFTAQPPDFWKWVGKHPDQVFSDPVVEDVLTSIDEKIPLALLRHRRRFG